MALERQPLMNSHELATHNHYTSAIGTLVAGISRREAIDNEFYRTWMSTVLPYHQVRAFAREYWARTQYTSVMVALSVIHTKDLMARVECVKNLFSEYGNGDPKKVHLVLLERFFEDLLSRLAGARVSMADVIAEGAAPSTRRFSEGQRALFTDP